MFATALGLCLLAGFQDKPPQEITPENIEVGKIGTIKRLTVVQVIDSTKYPIAASFQTVTVLVADYPAKGLGNGKVLPADQLWVVKDVTDFELAGIPRGTYIIKPVERKKEKK